MSDRWWGLLIAAAGLAMIWAARGMGVVVMLAGLALIVSPDFFGLFV